MGGLFGTILDEMILKTMFLMLFKVSFGLKSIEDIRKDYWELFRHNILNQVWFGDI